MKKNKLVWDDDVEEIDVGDGDFISISSSISVRDTAEMSVAANQGEASLVLLRHLVKSWRGPSFERDGEPVPCSPENIAKLEIGVATLVAGKIAEKATSVGMDDETKKESTESSSST